MKAKIDKLESNRKIKKKNQKLVKGIDGFKKGYQSRSNIVKDEKGDICYRLPHSYYG